MCCLCLHIGCVSSSRSISRGQLRMPFTSKHRFITYHNGGARMTPTWVLQIRPSKKVDKRIYTTFQTEAEAVEACCKVMKCTPKALLRKACTTVQVARKVSRHTHVWHDGLKFIAYTKSKSKRFATEMEAAAQAARWVRKPLTHLLKSKTRRILPQRIASLMRSLGKLFRTRVPADVESAVRHASTLSKDMYQAEPALIFPSLFLKYDIARVALVEQWKEDGRPSQNTSPDRAHAMLQLLTGVANRLHGNCGDNDYATWTANCGMASHIMGPVPFLLALGVVYKIKVSKTKNLPKGKLGSKVVKVLWLGKGNKLMYRLLSGTLERAKALRKIARVVDVGCILQRLFDNPPRTTLQWIERSDQLSQDLATTNAPFLLGGSKAYCHRWILRTCMISAMRAKGIRCLKIDETLTCEAFANHNPDVSCWVRRLARSVGVVSLHDLVNHLNYKGPVELFSMHLCFAGSRMLDPYDPKKIVHKHMALTGQQKLYRKKFGQDAIPSVLLKFATDNSIF
jgi:hypothetical protein